jgi:AraC-like DNA-binding protein
MSSVARLSPSYFSRAFSISFGCPPHAYVMKRRVERVKALMLSTEKPLGQIALECGFADQAHLSHLFRRHVGKSPAAWRRAQAPHLPDRNGGPASPLTERKCSGV